MHTIDLNCDMGEGIGQEELIFPFISSVNIACGAHAGDNGTMIRMIELARTHGVAIGAHPSYPDRENFGRIDLLDKGLQPEEIPAFLQDQLSLLQTHCQRAGTRLHHVKLHGALYNRAARDASISALVGAAIRQFNPHLLVYGLSGSKMETATRNEGMHFINEAFADRSYNEDASLTPRDHPGALIEDPAQAATQALRLAREGRVISLTGKEISVTAETICIHGDGHHAPEIAKRIFEALGQNNIRVKSPGL